MKRQLDIVVLGLSITSSWGNGHATTYRGLLREMAARGHRITFLERDVPWYRDNRDLPQPDFCSLVLYESLEQLRKRHREVVRNADVVIVGSYVPEGVAVIEWASATGTGVKAFYDIDTPVTLAKLAAGDHEYLAPSLIPRFDLYLSFTGGPTLRRLESQYGAAMARPLYCSFDPKLYRPAGVAQQWDLGYLGTYSADRQPTLERLLVEAARRAPERRFSVTGPQYPATIEWPRNVHRNDHLPPAEHAAYYSAQRFTLNVTRADMIAAGFSPSVRLFEAAACGTPIISDGWDGIETILRPGDEILIAQNANDTLHFLEMAESERLRIAAAARARVLADHTAAHRAVELEQYIESVTSNALPTL